MTRWKRSVRQVYTPKFCLITEKIDMGMCPLSQLSGLEQTVFYSHITVLHLHVAALFYLENGRKIHPQGVRAYQPKDVKEKRVGHHASVVEREIPKFLAPLLLYVLSSPCFLCKLCQPRVLLVLPEVLTLGP